MARKVVGPTGSRRRRWLFLCTGAVAIAAAVLIIPSAFAVHNDNLFELGPTTTACSTSPVGAACTATTASNIQGDGTFSNGPDWNDLFTSTGGFKDAIGSNGSAGADNIKDYLQYPGGTAAEFLIDDSSAGSRLDRSTFSGAGTSNKNSDPISTGDCSAGFSPALTGSGCNPWIWNSGNEPSKDDLTNVYSYAVVAPSDSADGSVKKGDLIIYSAFEREDPSGDSHVDVEYLQDQIKALGADATGKCVPTPPATNCTFSGHRTLGDVILSVDFLKGGGFGSATVRQWDPTKGYVLSATLGGTGCTKANGQPGDDVCAFDNEVPIGGGSWPSFDNHGNPISGNLPTNSFTEVGIDLTQALGETPCISTIMGKTRSSGSFTAELKDFAGPSSFPVCSAQIGIAPNATNEVGHSHTFTVSMSQKVGQTTSPAPDGTKATVTLTGSNGISGTYSGGGPGTYGDITVTADTCASTGSTGGTGQCSVTFVSSKAGKVTGSATATIGIGSDNFTVSTDGTGTNSGPATKTFVDGNISIGPNATNGIGENHTFTVTVRKNLGDNNGLVAAAGVNPTVSLTGSNGISASYSGGGPGIYGDVTVSADTCASTGTDSSGQCSVTFTSATPGTVTGSATATYTVSGVSITRATGDGAHSDGANATKTFVAGSLKWFKDDNAGNLLGGATFQVCRTKDRFGTTLTTAECVSVTDNLAPDTDSNNGVFKLTGLKLGHYTVQETQAPAGWVLDSHTYEADVGNGSQPPTALDAVISTHFVDQRPILKISGFAYTNTATGSPTSGVVSGTTTFKVDLHNYGGAAAILSGSSLTVSAASVPAGGSVTCGGNAVPSVNAITGTVAAGGDLTPQFQVTCTYTNAPGAVITASLVVKYKAQASDPTARDASGSPASISFTVEGA